MILFHVYKEAQCVEWSLQRKELDSSSRESLMSTLQWRRGEKSLFGESINILSSHHRIMSLLAGHGIIQICRITCGIIQMCCLTFIDNDYCAGCCAEQVYASWTPASFIYGGNGKVVKFRRLEMLNFLFSIRKLHLSIQIQSRSSIIKPLLFKEASDFYFFSLASALCCYSSHVIGFMISVAFEILAAQLSSIETHLT